VLKEQKNFDGYTKTARKLLHKHKATTTATTATIIQIIRMKKNMMMMMPKFMLSNVVNHYVEEN